MKRIILDGSKNYYKANLHSHSTNSDGKMTPEEIKEAYRKNGYSVVAFTDHEYLIDNSYLNDENFLAITSCELAVKEDEKVSTLIKQDMKICHLNLYAKNPQNNDTPCYSSSYVRFLNDRVRDIIKHTCGEYKREYSPKGISEIIRIANEKGFLVCYNHPRWSLENATDYLGYKGLWAVEVYNTSCNTLGVYEYDINAYDDFLRDGQKLACVMGDDNHKINDTFGGYVMINAEKLDYATVMEALENHSFYSTTGPIIKDLYIEDDEAYITFENAEFVTMSTRGRRSQRQEASNPDGENTLSFKLQLDDVYVRFDVVDKNGKRANTNAVWF